MVSEDGELEHSIRGPSGATGWRRCKGKINAERGLPDVPTRAAAEGTVFHEYAAMCLMFGLDPEDFPLGVKHQQDGFEIEFDEDMQHYMHEGLAWVRERVEPGDILLVERRVDISPWAGAGEFGTADVLIIKRAKRHIINFDWKYGKGVPVSPIRNDQMYLYNLGGWNDYAKRIFKGVDPSEIKVTFHIEQPRAPGGGGTWHTDMADCLAEGKLIREDALATMDPEAPRTPGEKQCLFCKAASQCREQQEYLLRVFGQKFEDIEEGIELGVGPAFDDPERLTLETRSYILLHWKAFKRYVDRIHALVLHDLKAGKEVPLLKAVTGRGGHRAFIADHEAEAGKWLAAQIGKEQAYETKLISPAAAEKLVGKKAFGEHLKAFVTQPPGKPILVPLDDKRDPIQDYASKFDDSFIDDDDDE